MFLLNRWIFTKVKSSTSIHMYLLIYLGIMLFRWCFIIIVYTVVLLTSPRYFINFPIAISLNQCVSVFCGVVSQTYQMSIYFHPNGIWYHYMNIVVLVPLCSSKPCKPCSSYFSCPFFPTLFLFLILPNICIWVPLCLSHRWLCLWWCVVFLFISTRCIQ